MIDLLIGLCLATAADVAKVPGWALHVTHPQVVVACYSEPYPTMKALKRGDLIWPK
jgi:hypothetical protein